MTNSVKPVPEGFHTMTPYVTFDNASEAIEFYKEAFGATELFRLADPDGKIVHAEIKIGDSPLMLHDAFPEFPIMRSPQSIGGSPVQLYLYVEDADALMDQAVGAGAKVLMPVENQVVDGDRRGGLEDPYGLVWWVATHIEDVSREEIQKRYDNSVEG